MTKAYALVIVLLLAIIALFGYQAGMFTGMFGITPPGPGTSPYEGECNLPSAPTL